MCFSIKGSEISSSQTINRSHVLYIAWPIILSNLSTPLLGLVDTAVIGNLGDPALIGAIAIGGLIFSFLFWGFGFLRMGTTGLIAQAKGAGNQTEVKATFYRAFIAGMLIGSLMLVLQHPLGRAAMLLIDGSAQVENAAMSYFQIRIWAAPVSLAHLAIMGFLLGQQDSKSLLLIQLVLNGTNILLDFAFVVGFGWGVEGVAVATLISEVIAIGLGSAIVMRKIRTENQAVWVSKNELLKVDALRRMFVVNRDIMVRTLCLIFALAWFTNQGAQSGDVILSANAILMQFVSFAAFFMDGFAIAAESLVGNAIGARNSANLNLAIRYSTELGALTSLILSVLFWMTGGWLIHIITNIASVRETAEQYLIWATVAPVLSIWCYLLDGIFIGATRTSEMRNAMILSLSVYLAAWYFLADIYGNHGLWASLQIFFIARALSLRYYLPRLKQIAS